MNHRDQERIHSMKTTIRNSISGLPRNEQLPRTQALRIIGGLPLILLALACFAFMQRAQATEPVEASQRGRSPRGYVAFCRMKRLMPATMIRAASGESTSNLPCVAALCKAAQAVRSL